MKQINRDCFWRGFCANNLLKIDVINLICVCSALKYAASIQGPGDEW